MPGRITEELSMNRPINLLRPIAALSVALALAACGDANAAPKSGFQAVNTGAVADATSPAGAADVTPGTSATDSPAPTETVEPTESASAAVTPTPSPSPTATATTAPGRVATVTTAAPRAARVQIAG